MAKQNSTNTSSVGTRSFDKNLNENVNDFHLPEGTWTQARNAINNSVSGDLGKIGNEPGNLFCTQAPYTVIGIIHLVSDYWLIYSTDDTDSEIGIFHEESCTYTKAVNDQCLGFKRTNLIIGVARPTSDCVFNAYWDDGLNVSRAASFTIKLPGDNDWTNPDSPLPWIQTCNTVNNCQICVNTNRLDCDAIRLARFITPPCVEVLKGAGAGTLLNGSYMVFIAYAIKGQKISDWYGSNVQSLFVHGNAGSALDVNILSLDQDFDEILVTIVSITNGQSVARNAGIYNTRQTRLSFDNIDNQWPAVPVEQLPIMTPIMDKTDAMYNVNDLLLRVGPTSKEDFNYQPLANQIVTKWQSVEYPADYYRKGGNKTNYLRDEVYAFFIRWVYDTGDKSSSYHIPGRPALSARNDWTIMTGPDASPELAANLKPYRWRVYNTAVQTSPLLNTPLPDGGVLVGEGLMGYWESSEDYPDDKPQVWDANTNQSQYSTLGQGFPITNTGAVLNVPGQAHDLCGQPIRHHKFPDLNTSPQCEYRNPTNGKIRIMGVKFENILRPVSLSGVPMTNIVGYEILRGARNGNKTILAKGLINNMRTYQTPDGTSNRTFMFPNYPYNEVNRIDPFLSTSKVLHPACPVFGGGLGIQQYKGLPASSYSQTHFTFHSPDTNFYDPYLSAKEIKIHGEFNGDVTGKFEKSEEHPKEKLITNTAFAISAIAGLGLAALASNGKRTIRYTQPIVPGYSQDGLRTVGSGTAIIYTGASWSSNKILGSDGAQPRQGDQGGISTFNSITGIVKDYNGVAGLGGYNFDINKGDTLQQNLGGNTSDSKKSAIATLFKNWQSGSKDYTTSAQRNIDQEDGPMKNTPFALRQLSNIPLFFNYFTQGTDTVLDFFKAVLRYKDFALRYHSHAFYQRYRPSIPGNTRRVINEQNYIGPQITDFGLNARINNLYRAKTVAIEANIAIANTTVNDVTRIRASSVNPLYDQDNFKTTRLVDPTKQSFGAQTSYKIGSAGSISAGTDRVQAGNAGSFYPGHTGIQIASSHYASLKQRIDNQYGYITGVQQIPTGNCVMPVPAINTAGTSDVIFGGDTYVSRYTEKNTFFFFYNWLYGQPDGAQFDYTKNEMIPYPRYWANFDGFETGDFTTSAVDFINPLGGNFFNPNALILPNSYYNLDGLKCIQGAILNFLSPTSAILNMRLGIKDAWFYLFNSGVKDFLVESEINVDLRDWGETEVEQHYDPYRYSDTKAIFNTKIIKTGNYYKYDQSLSIGKLFINYISWAAAQVRDYDPFLARTCYIYRPNRLIYSLPSQFESNKDSWYVFLANNYGDFDNRITGIKSVNKSGALIFFDAASPIEFNGLDQLQTTSGTKLTIGDGGLFTQPPRGIVDADKSYEFASCQNRMSIINTPMGLYWMCQNQGKIFRFNGGAEEVSMKELKWWFATYMPYNLTKDFPSFELIDNPVIGIGCQSIFDNENGLAYFMKKDYVLKKDIPFGITVQYVGANLFNIVSGPTVLFQVSLGDPRYFEDASWTVSYDPKTGGWISHHDWHPTLVIPGKKTFLTIDTDSLWIHNERCDLYCNYYGVDYPFELEYMVNTAQTVNSLRSVEYILESYKYAPNCYDRFHVLDFNFDEAVIYNTEQVSGLLRLNLAPKNDPQALLAYPAINFADIDIIYSKEEQKHRFDQFWDITADRGEFNPIAQRVIWNTSPNGYVRELNANNLNYTKDAFQRKKFRHYTNSVFLRRKVSGDRKMLVLLTNNKNLYSPR